MLKDRTRRNFLRTSAAAAAALPLAESFLFTPAAAAQSSPTPEAFQLIKAEGITAAEKKLAAAPGNETLYESKALPFTVVLTTEEKKFPKEFEYHEGRDHVFQILEGETVYELGGTPQNPRNTKPGEWLAPTSTGATRLTLRKGDMLVIPRNTPHKRTTEGKVTLTLISTTGPVKA